MRVFDQTKACVSEAYKLFSNLLNRHLPTHWYVAITRLETKEAKEEERLIW